MNDVKDDGGSPSRRPYNSPKRAQAALERRRRMRATAERLFMRDGYEPTTMLRIASEAGVAEKTLYLAYPSKASLLDEIIRVGVRGDDGDQPLTRRAPWAEMLAAASVPEVVASFAAGVAALMSRAARLLWLGEANAAGDPQLRDARTRAHADIRTDMREFAGALVERGALAPGLEVEQAASILFATCANETIFLRLVDECAWAPEQYAELIETLIARLPRRADRVRARCVTPRSHPTGT
jgi:AcrR family transcriptional regulator